MHKAKRLVGLLNRTEQRARYSTHTKGPETVPTLPDGTLSTFRSRAFQIETPALLPRGHFTSLPASQKWFKKSADVAQSTFLDVDYLSQYGTAIVPLEITSDGHFAQIEQPLQFFIDASTTSSSPSRIYLAQVSLADLPAQLRLDVPTPDLVLQAGKGDIYSTSIWLGLAPTYTPLHRDPNPNLFVQLAGRKRVRLFNPNMGGAVFHHVQTSIGGRSSATMRGAEMMEGAERKVLEEAVWSSGDDNPWWAQEMECEVGPGDGLFIPKGWWHSIKGVGEGITGSVNWWFR